MLQGRPDPYAHKYHTVRLFFLLLVPLRRFEIFTTTFALLAVFGTSEYGTVLLDKEDPNFNRGANIFFIFFFVACCYSFYLFFTLTEHTYNIFYI